MPGCCTNAEGRSDGAVSTRGFSGGSSAIAFRLDFRAHALLCDSAQPAGRLCSIRLELAQTGWSIPGRKLPDSGSRRAAVWDYTRRVVATFLAPFRIIPGMGAPVVSQSHETGIDAFVATQTD